MRKYATLLLAMGIFAGSCNNQQNKKESMNNSNDAAFDSYKERFVEALWRQYPGWASSVGYHKYDSILIVPDAAAREKEIAFCKGQLDSLQQFDDNSLSDNNKIDKAMMRNQLESSIWSVNEEKSYEWNPAQYNISEGFADILNGTYDSLDNRLHNIGKRLAVVPAFYEAAKQNIKNPTVEHTQLAIEQNIGGASVFEQDLPAALQKSHLSEAEKAVIKEKAALAATAMKGYADWLKNLKNDHPRSFRLGKELYAKKFDFDIQSGYTVDEIYKKAQEHKQELHTKMAALANQLWSKYMGNTQKPADSLLLIRQVIDKISLQHTIPDSFQAAIEKQIPVLVDFIKKKDLIYIDPAKPLVVRKEPAYMAGVAGASINAPGPYDKGGNTYYNVGSLSGWDKQKAESYLREYNNYTLQILNIHEAIPGHYTQLVYSNQSPSIIKAILGNGAMVEGWAVYTERMMLEEGYGNNEPEMWLMYYKWNLRSTCNTILDHDVHAGNMTKEQAMHLLMDEAFQQQSEAEGKWRRVNVTQVQLCSYFTGYMEIYELREELKKKMGDKFNLKAFHEKFLSYGSTPVKYIKEMMLKDIK
ncbi:MAG: hypothetical protein BGO70_16685 [Bacteroidetes bacterium 43-93]|nr:DUF885 domain-containing protein [Bacteroidota bacterium]OJX01397.1 MAG: hypothetical protein BGO70_16685 [Bacteroidetes bacterium 43-93]